MMKTLDFYFDFVSNNAYLAWTQLDQLCQDHNLVLNPVPVLFTGLLNAHDNVGPAEVPAKRQWMSKNILRKAALLGVPMQPPLHHPFNPLLPLRACTQVEGAQQQALIDGLFKSVWVNQQHISEPEVIAEIATKVGIDAEQLLSAACSDLAKASLKDNTQRAAEAGVFGIPSMIVEGELFFGYDDFEFLQRFLHGKDPIAGLDLSGWNQAAMSPSSKRKAPNSP